GPEIAPCGGAAVRRGGCPARPRRALRAAPGRRTAAFPLQARQLMGKFRTNGSLRPLRPIRHRRRIGTPITEADMGRALSLMLGLVCLLGALYTAHRALEFHRHGEVVLGTVVEDSQAL